MWLPPMPLFAGLAPQPRDKGGKEEAKTPTKNCIAAKPKPPRRRKAEGTMNGVRKGPLR